MRAMRVIAATALAALLAAVVAVVACAGDRGATTTTTTTTTATSAKATSTVALQLPALNDSHGYIEPPADSNGNINGLPAGGVDHLAATIADLRAKNPAHTIVVAAGDLV